MQNSQNNVQDQNEGIIGTKIINMLRDRGRNKITNTAIMIGIIEPRTPRTHTPPPLIPVQIMGKRNQGIGTNWKGIFILS